MSKKNVPIAVGFATITISQAGLGICTVVLAARKGGKTSSSTGYAVPGQSANVLRHDRPCAAQALPPIPFDAYRLCVFVQHRTLEIVYTGISLLYGARDQLQTWAGWH